MAKRTRYSAFILSEETQRKLLRILHCLEEDKGKRITWDDAFSHILDVYESKAESGIPNIESREAEA